MNTGKIKPFYPKPNQGGRDFNMLPGQHGNPVGLVHILEIHLPVVLILIYTTLSSESQCRDHECCRYILGTHLPKNTWFSNSKRLGPFTRFC